MKRKKERVDMIRDALKETVHGVKSMAGKRSCNLPRVMGLVETLWKREKNQIVTNRSLHFHFILLRSPPATKIAHRGSSTYDHN